MSNSLLKKAEPKVTEMAVVARNQSDEQRAKPSYVMTATEILALGVREIPMLIFPILQKVGIATLIGSSDVGKSYLLLYLAMIICSEDDEVLGCRIYRRHGSVIIVCTEETQEDLCVRLSSMIEGKTIDREKLRFILETSNLVEKLRSELQREPADLVIIDTFGDLFQGTLNDSISVRQFLSKYKELAREFRCLFLFNHHIAKGKEHNSLPSKNDTLGSQGIESASRTVLALRKIDLTKRSLTVVKGNYIPDEIKNQGIQLGYDQSRGFWRMDGNTVQQSVQVTCIGEKECEEKVLVYYDKYGSCRKVAKELTKDGYPIGKTKVGEIVKKARPSEPNPRE